MKKDYTHEPTYIVIFAIIAILSFFPSLVAALKYPFFLSIVSGIEDTQPVIPYLSTFVVMFVL